jgi:hypothetical protein
MKFFPEARVPSYGCGTAGRNCDWKGFAGGVTVGACCFTCTDLEIVSNARVINLRVSDIFSCLSKSRTSRSANR